MDKTYEVNENTGNIKISEEVVATIAEIAVNEIDGVCSTGSTLAGEIKKLVKKTSGKGVRVAFNDKLVTIDISLIIKFGVRIPEVAWNVQENVKKQVESMTGLIVDKVNIHVTGINAAEDTNACETDEKEKEEKSEE